MLQQIADLVEFDLNRFSEGQVLEDFNHKFQNSILKIDGTYLKVSHLERLEKELLLYAVDKEDNEIKIKELKTIEKVLPKTGLYSSKYGMLYLYRMPKRQWIKSLKIGANYDIHTLMAGVNDKIPTIWNTVLAEEHEYNKESMIYRDIVYLHWTKVGKVVDKTILVTKEKFIEEIKEIWNQQYQIISDANNLRRKAERLTLDF